MPKVELQHVSSSKQRKLKNRKQKVDGGMMLNQSSSCYHQTVLKCLAGIWGGRGGDERLLSGQKKDQDTINNLWVRL